MHKLCITFVFLDDWSGTIKGTQPILIVDKNCGSSIEEQFDKEYRVSFAVAFVKQGAQYKEDITKCWGLYRV